MSMTNKNMRAALMVALGGFMLATQVPVWGMEEEIKKDEKIEPKFYTKKDITPEILTKWSEELKGKDLVIEAMNEKDSHAKMILDSVLFCGDVPCSKSDFKEYFVIFARREIWEEFGKLGNNEKEQKLLSGLATWFVENKNNVDIPSVFCNFADLYLGRWGGVGRSLILDDKDALNLLVAIYDKDQELAKKIFNSLPLKGSWYTRKSFYMKVAGYCIFGAHMDTKIALSDFNDLTAHEKKIALRLEAVSQLCCGKAFFSEFWSMMKDEEFKMHRDWLERFCSVFLEKQIEKEFELKLFTLPHAIVAALGLAFGGIIPSIDSDDLTILGIGALGCGAVSEFARRGAIYGGDDWFFKVGRQAKWPAIFLGAAFSAGVCKYALPKFCSKNKNIQNSNCNTLGVKKMLNLNPNQL